MMVEKKDLWQMLDTSLGSRGRDSTLVESDKIRKLESKLSPSLSIADGGPTTVFRMTEGVRSSQTSTI